MIRQPITTQTPLEALILIEDNDADIALIERAIAKVNRRIKVVVKTTAEEGLQFLKEAEELPQLIILDLNFPKMSGIQFMQELRVIDHLKNIPIVLVSVLVEEMIRAYNDKLANGYIMKPINEQDFKNAFSQLGFQT